MKVVDTPQKGPSNEEAVSTSMREERTRNIHSLGSFARCKFATTSSPRCRFAPTGKLALGYRFGWEYDLFGELGKMVLANFYSAKDNRPGK